MKILDAHSHRTRNPDGTYSVRIFSDPVYYRDDADEWKPVVHGSHDELPGNCEFVPVAGGFKMWSPAGEPPYDPAWLPTDYWIQVVTIGGTFTTRRMTVLESRPEASILTTTWSDNLTRTVEDGIEVWRAAHGGIVFMRLPATTVGGVTASMMRFA